MSLDADGLAQLVNLAVELNESEDHEASVRDAVTERFPAAYEAPAGLPVATWIDNLDLDTLGTAIGELLDELYPQVPILLDHSDPYTLLVAVALSAQTTDKKVNQITPALFDAAGTPEKMAAMDPDEILGYIREVGLAPTKAKNLWLAANQIVDQGGEVIGDWEFLEALPGIGHKTASVVMSQAFGVPAFAVDTHVHRLADRWGLSKGTTVERTEADLKAVFPIETWNDRHLQIIFFGREYCPARRHDLATCPICSWAATKKRIRDESMR